jgi:hypothetical protein
MKEKLAKLLLNDSDFQKISIKDLAKKYNCGKATINRAIRLAGLKKEVSKLETRKYSPKSKQEILISDELHAIIVGSLLGDGYITPYRRENGNSKARNKNSSLIIKHGFKQKEYVIYKQRLIEKHITCYLRKMKRKDERFKNPVYFQYALETMQNLAFNKYRDTWYKDNKVIPFETFKLTPLTLAIWFQDDGSNAVSGYLLCTNGFTREEVERLRNMLHQLNLKNTVQKSGLNYVIYIKAESVKTFNALVLPYMCKSMMYKIIFKS